MLKRRQACRTSGYLVLVVWACIGSAHFAAKALETTSASSGEEVARQPKSRIFTQSFKETSVERGVVEEAVGIANLLMSDDVSFKLCPSWRVEPAGKREMIPVYLGEPRGQDYKPPAALVPAGERCIIIVEKNLPALWHSMGNNGKFAVKQKNADLLAITLLHEAGHLDLRHSGSMDDPAETLREFENFHADEQKRNRDVNANNFLKQRETAADAFVARIIKSAEADKKNTSRNLRGMVLGSAIGMVGFNLEAERIDKAPGSIILGSEEFFWDKGISHPNMHLRILRINAALSPNSKYPQLLREFEAMQPKVRGEILYKKPETPTGPENRSP